MSVFPSKTRLFLALLARKARWLALAAIVVLLAILAWRHFAA